MPIEKLYPPVQFPVSAGTPMISPLIKWDHANNYLVVNLDADAKDYGAEQKFNILISAKEYEFISGHRIDGIFIFSNHYRFSFYIKPFQAEYFSQQLATCILHGLHFLDYKAWALYTKMYQ